MMKKIFLLIGFFSLSILQAQKIAYVDTKRILEELPSYQNALVNLENETKKWVEEIKQNQNDYQQKKDRFEEDKILMTDNQIEDQKYALDSIKTEVEKLQEKRFGANGDLINLRKRMVKPIQDQVYQAVQQLSKARGYGMVIDKADGLVLIYTEPRFDITQDVINLLKPKNNENTSQPLRNNKDSKRNSK